MRKKIYFYLDQPAGNEQLYKVLPKKLRLKNYQIKYFSTEKINFFKKDLFNYYKNSSRKDIPNNVIKLNSKKNLENFIKKISINDYVFIRERSFLKNNNLDYDLKLFEKYGIKTIFLEYDNWIECNFHKEVILNIFRFLWVVVKKFFIKSNNFQPYYCLGSGAVGKKNFLKNKWDKTKYIDCPSIWIDFSKKKKKKYLVYVDENIFFSRDQFILNKNYRKSSNPSKFLSDLLKFFEIIEKKFNQKIIICCSNKFHYRNKNIFGGRKIIYGKTLQFISESKLVLGHRSDSFYQALFTKTPVILLKHRSFDFKRNIYIILKSINVFNKKANFIEDYLTSKCNLDFNVDKKFYKNILNKYFLSSNLKKENFAKFFFKKLNNVEI